jgi:hypothetical protein
VKYIEPKFTVGDGGSIVAPGIGGPSPGARDNPGTESFPNQNPAGGDAGTGGSSSGSGGSDGGGGGGGDTTPTGPMDWSSMLGIYGLPPDVAAKVKQIFTTTTDVSQATALASPTSGEPPGTRRPIPASRKALRTGRSATRPTTATT